ncbi:MAG: hypothetical protein ACFFEF_06795 [Candidatus Thorarchaeota archaeon]
MTYSEKELKNYLKGLVKQQSGLANFSFEYNAGHTAFHSRLRIILSSDQIIHWKIPKGTPVDSSEEGKAAKIRKTDFSTEKLSAFAQDLMKLKIWDLENCAEKALPDAALLSFSIKDKEAIVFERKVWERCRNDNKQTKELLKTLARTLPPDWTPP